MVQLVMKKRTIKSEHNGYFNGIGYDFLNLICVNEWMADKSKEI
jgi:hypothetical protein